MPTAVVTRPASWTERRDVFSESWVGPVYTSSEDTPYLGVGSYESFRKERTWVRTPGYGAKKKAGIRLPDNAFSYTERTRSGSSQIRTVRTTSYTSGNTKTQTRTTENFRNPTFGEADLVPGRILTNNVLDAQLINKAKSNQFNVPIFLAEGKKTSSMVIQTAKKLVDLLRALRRGDIAWFLDNLHFTVRPKGNKRSREILRFNRHYGQHAFEAVGSTWLAWKYGWSPFMADLRNAVNTLMDTVEVPVRTEGRVKGSHTLEQTVTAPFTVQVSPLIVVTRTTFVQESLRGTWRFAPNSVDLPSRFGLTNPLEIAWELIPLSFVADWFLPIGSYLSALDAPMRFIHVGGTRGYRMRVEVTDRDPKDPTGFYDRVSGATASGTYTSVRRLVMSAPPSVSLTADTFRSDLNVPQMLSSIALLSQSLSQVARGMRRSGTQETN